MEREEVEAAEQDLKAALELKGRAAQSFVEAWNAYVKENDEPPPFPFDRADPKMAAFVEVFARRRSAEDARDDALYRLGMLRLHSPKT